MTYGVARGFRDEGELIHDNLIAGEFPRYAEMVTVTGTGLLRRGAVLGQTSLDGRYKLSDAAETDGSQVPQVILAQDIDITAGDTRAVIYMTGEYNEFALSFGPGHSVETVRPALKDNSIFLKKNQPA